MAYWAHLDESYSWWSLDRSLEGGFAQRRKSHPKHYAKIPKALYDELVEAESRLRLIQNRVSAYRGKELDTEEPT